jgi:TadE-like protein
VARSANRERGTALIEFMFAGVPLIFLLLIIFELCLAMWSYHTLATAVEDGAVYASTKGQDCTYTGNTCRVTISAIVQDILSAGIGINPNQLSLTFHSSASAFYADIICNPASSCLTGTNASTYWPPALVSSGPPAVYGNTPAISYVDITGTCPAPVPIISLFWQARSLAGIGSLQFSAKSRQIVQF